jgi:hypothetical protein
MNDEFRKLDEKLCGIQPGNYSSFSSGCTDRLVNEYSWNDLDFNLNAVPFQRDTAVIVTSYYGHLMWLKNTLASYRKTGAYVVLAYDNSPYVWDNLDDAEFILHKFPRPLHFLLCHAYVLKHKTYDADKRTGWFWNAKYAQNVVRGFENIKYVYVTNGDCFLRRPEGMSEMPEVLGGGDLVSGQSTPNSTIHTADLFMKAEAFYKIMDYMSSRMKYTIMAGQSPEALLRDAVDDIGLKETFVDYPTLSDGSIDYYCTHDIDSTFKRVLGFKNLYAEQEYRENNRLPPLEKEYMDGFHGWLYATSEWKETLCKYYSTGDRRYLYMWWDRGCDTDTDRRYYPLEHYGTEPIYDEEK